jgi:hypothetical protein
MRNFAIDIHVPIVSSNYFGSVDADRLVHKLVDKLVDPDNPEEQLVVKKDCILFCSADKSSYFGQTAIIA